MAVPVQGAYRSFGGLAPEKVRSTVTGREGKAKLESLPPGPWNVTVHARGFVTQPTRRVASGPLAVRLEKGGVITGVVREADGNRPIAGARVGVGRRARLPGDWSDEATRNETVTDAEGRFRLEGIGRAPETALGSRARVRAGRAQRRPGGGERVELFLFPGATLAGRRPGRRRAAGEGRRGAGRGRTPLEREPPAERTDARGEFELAGVQPGEYTVVVAREGGRALGIATVVVEPEGEASVELVLSDGGYRHRAYRGRGRATARRARSRSRSSRTAAFRRSRATCSPRREGRRHVRPRPAAARDAAASASPRRSRASRRVEASFPARGRTVDLGDVALEAGLAIRGRVADREGTGIGGASVRAQGPAGEGRPASRGHGRRGGRLRGGRLRPGPLRGPGHRRRLRHGV